MKYRFFVYALTAVAVAGTVVAQNSTNTPPKPAAIAVKADEVVARIGNTAIKRHELRLAVSGLLMQLQRQGQVVPPEQIPQLERNVLEELVGREVVLQSAQANLPAGLDEKVKAQVERTRTMAGGDDALNKSLQEAGITRADFERRTRDNIIVTETLRQITEKQVQLTPDEIKAFYDGNIARFKQPEMVRASHILVRVAPDASEDIKKANKTKINAARSLVVNGEKFADIARKVSDDPGSAPNGGDLGFFPRGAMVPEFDKVAFSLATNQVSEVFTTTYGYHVMTVTDRKAEKQLSMDEVKGDIERFLRNRKGGEIVSKYVKGLRETAKVEILLPPLPSPSVPAPKP